MLWKREWTGRGAKNSQAVVVFRFVVRGTVGCGLRRLWFATAWQHFEWTKNGERMCGDRLSSKTNGDVVVQCDDSKKEVRITTRSTEANVKKKVKAYCQIGSLMRSHELTGPQ